MSKSLITILIAIVLFIALIIMPYNSLVTQEEDVSGKWSQVENQLQRRNDLIPNLVNTVQGIANQERSLVQAVTDARTKMVNAKSPGAASTADSELVGVMSRLMVVTESYPQIKSDANFRQLADELAGTENRIAIARKDYNDSVQRFNTNIKTFPKGLIAKFLGYTPKEYFRVEESAKKLPAVNFK